MVIDVLRATSTLSYAFAAGAAEARFFATPESTRAARRDLGGSDILLCGEREGIKIPGFDLGNSPLEYQPEMVRDRTLLFASTNGSLAFLATSKHPRYDRPWTDLVYQPMLELFDLLRANGWRIFVCSGGGRDFMRVFSEEAWGIYRENVIGSAPEFAYEDGRLVRRNELHGNIALGPGKLEHIYARTGRTALFAGGNGDVDLEMLQEARFRLVIVHDDAEREYVVTAAAEKLLAAGDQGGWTMVSMKDYWKTIFKD